MKSKTDNLTVSNSEIITIDFTVSKIGFARKSLVYLLIKSYPAWQTITPRMFSRHYELMTSLKPPT